MDPSKIALGSPLHRLLRWTPGYVPTWVCSRNNCTGFDFLIAVEVCPVLGAVLLGKFYGHWWLLGVIIPLVFAFGVLLHIPFMVQEQRARIGTDVVTCHSCGRILYVPLT